MRKLGLSLALAVSLAVAMIPSAASAAPASPSRSPHETLYPPGRPAIITGDHVNIHNAPSIGTPVVDTFAINTRVTYYGEGRGGAYIWAHVSGIGETGRFHDAWVVRDYVRIL